MRDCLKNRVDKLKKQLFEVENDLSYHRGRWEHLQNVADNINEQLEMIEHNIDKDQIKRTFNLRVDPNKYNFIEKEDT